MPVLLGTLLEGLPEALKVLGFLLAILVNQGSQDCLAWPMVATRLMGCLILGLYFLAGRRSLQPPKKTIPLILLNFALDIGGTITYIMAGQLGRMDATAVLWLFGPGYDHSAGLDNSG